MFFIKIILSFLPHQWSSGLPAQRLVSQESNGFEGQPDQGLNVEPWSHQGTAPALQANELHMKHADCGLHIQGDKKSKELLFLGDGWFVSLMTRRPAFQPQVSQLKMYPPVLLTPLICHYFSLATQTYIQVCGEMKRSQEMDEGRNCQIHSFTQKEFTDHQSSKSSYDQLLEIK